MRKYVLVILVIGLILSLSEQVFSQEKKTGDNSSGLFNEGGYVRGITTARVIGLAELAMGVSSLVVALRAKKRSVRKGAAIALGLGIGAVVFSAIHFLVAAGAVFGSGSGKAGAIIAFVFGLIGIIIAYSYLGISSPDRRTA